MRTFRCVRLIIVALPLPGIVALPLPGIVALLLPGIVTLLLPGIVALLLPGCAGGPTGNSNTNGNDNGSATEVRGETRDFSEFRVFSYDAGNLTCLQLGNLARATIVDLSSIGAGFRVDLIHVQAGDPATDECEENTSGAACLILQGPETGMLTASEVEELLDLFANVRVLLDPEPECTPSGCADEFEWDAETTLSSAMCASAPRLSPEQGLAITDLLERFRNR